MTPPFSVQSAPHYERLAKKLLRGHPDFLAVQTRAGAILCADPYNASRQHHIKKLEGVAAGEGQFRLTMGRWRFRYDIVGREVRLVYCGLRREDTYRKT
jgi:hypothetical protein